MLPTGDWKDQCTRLLIAEILVCRVASPSDSRRLNFMPHAGDHVSL
jgi:hypothetical protein